MVKIALQLRAEMENIQRLFVCPETFHFWVKVKCSNCGETDGKMHNVCQGLDIPNRIGPGHCHYASKCKLCGREGTIKILEESFDAYEKGKDFCTIVEFECRGLELTHFDYQGKWLAGCEYSNKLFDNVDFAEGDWVEYDECSKMPVGIFSPEYRFFRK